MKVWIKGQVYDSNDTPIILLLDKSDKNLIKNMSDNNSMYMVYPENMLLGNAEKVMLDVKKDLLG